MQSRITRNLALGAGFWFLACSAERTSFDPPSSTDAEEDSQQDGGAGSQAADEATGPDGAHAGGTDSSSAVDSSSGEPNTLPVESGISNDTEPTGGTEPGAQLAAGAACGGTEECAEGTCQRGAQGMRCCSAECSSDEVCSESGECFACEPGAKEECWESADGEPFVMPPTDEGSCQIGERRCTTAGQWSPCEAAVGPADKDSCEVAGADDDCNGTRNEGCTCTNGDSRPCGTDVGNCELGMQTCAGSAWGECEGEVEKEAQDDCAVDEDDADCDGEPNGNCGCVGTETRDCNDCGEQTCNPQARDWGACSAPQDPAETRCVGNGEALVETCSPQGNWVGSMCEFVCTNGACGGSCEPGGACGQPSCTTLTNAQSEPTGTTFVPQGTCNDNGSCSAATATSCPNSLVCASATACKTSCASDADCLEGNACTDGVCGGKKGTGTACSASNQCQSDQCIDGFCCESECTGKCRACSQAKTGVANGYCRDVTLGTDPDAECAVDAGNACGLDGMCGTGGACRFQPPSLSCGAASCSQGMYTPTGSCNGTGQCVAGTPAECTGHMPCSSGTACATTCTANSTTGCPSGYKCASNGNSCILATMACGGSPCALANGGGACCIDGPLGGPYTETCIAPGGSCSGSAMQCHSAVDCPSGQICCGSRGGCVTGSTRCVLPSDALCQDGGMSSADQFCDATISPAECLTGSCLTDGLGSCGPNHITTCR